MIKPHKVKVIEWLAMSRIIDPIKYYAIISAIYTHYYEDWFTHLDVKYDQDYAINNGIVFG